MINIVGLFCFNKTWFAHLLNKPDVGRHSSRFLREYDSVHVWLSIESFICVIG